MLGPPADDGDVFMVMVMVMVKVLVTVYGLWFMVMVWVLGDYAGSTGVIYFQPWPPCTPSRTSWLNCRWTAVGSLSRSLSGKKRLRLA